MLIVIVLIITGSFMWFTRQVLFFSVTICFGRARSVTDLCSFTKLWSLFFFYNAKSHLNNKLEETALLVCNFDCATLTQKGESHVLWQLLPCGVCCCDAREPGQAGSCTWRMLWRLPPSAFFFWGGGDKRKWTHVSTRLLLQRELDIMSCIKFTTVICYLVSRH